MNLAPQLPPDMDPDFYRAQNSDLADFPDQALIEHYRRFGESEGRVGSSGMPREDFMAGIVQRDTGNVLEIGPFNCPALRGANVRYLDVFDAEELRRRAAQSGLDPAGCPETIDFTCPLSEVDERFSAIFSSHAIEHQPDLVQHLIDIGNKLQPGGRYYIVVPDRRYCFDALRAESTVGGVLQAHCEKRTRHTFENVVNYFAERTHNDSAAHWRGDVAYRELADPVAAVAEASSHFDAADGDYVDTHAWQFTPVSFRRITTTLYKLGLSQLVPLRVYNTPYGRLEFCAVLENGGPATT